VKKAQLKTGQVLEEMPKFGYADPRSYAIIKGAVDRLKQSGAVRHGPECFNYGFPQETDDEFLVISDTFSGVPWRYIDVNGLIEILEEKVEQGFTFPLNPKWILADGAKWHGVYNKLMASTKPNVKDSLEIWYPPQIRNRIEKISRKYPNGFTALESKTPLSSYKSCGVLFDLAQLELRRFEMRLAAQKKLRSAVSQAIIVPTIKDSFRQRRRHSSLKFIPGEPNLIPLNNPRSIPIAGEPIVEPYPQQFCVNVAQKDDIQTLATVSEDILDEGPNLFGSFNEANQIEWASGNKEETNDKEANKSNFLTAVKIVHCEIGGEKRENRNSNSVSCHVSRKKIVHDESVKMRRLTEDSEGENEVTAKTQRSSSVAFSSLNSSLTQACHKAKMRRFTVDSKEENEVTAKTPRRPSVAFSSLNSSLTRAYRNVKTRVSLKTARGKMK